MSNDNLKDIDLEFLRACLKEAGQLVLAKRGRFIANVKPDRTPVTEFDQQAEDFLIEKIQSRYPGHQVLSEESGQRPGTLAYTWVIDPIDGTRAFASGLPVWGVSIGILRDGEPYAGGLYLPVTGEMYWGTTTAAYYNERQLEPLHAVDLNSALVFLAIPSNFHLRYTSTYPRARSMGSIAAHLAYTTTGAAVGTFVDRASLWDIAGLLPALQAVGIEQAYLNGRAFSAADLLDGAPLREGLLFAHPSVMGQLRDSIIAKK